ncbi:MAG: MBL fold metallo-hydrolase [Clostridia bacterium]|nr:MBL fold metallo-hydrolase [Clostridia bacterium]
MIRFCTLFSSSGGNSIFISDGNTNLLIDAGVSAAKIVNSLESIGVSPKELDGILVTHEHSDHVSGIGVLTRKFGIPVYANEATMEKILSSSSTPAAGCTRIITTGQSFKLRSAQIRSFKTPHDSADSVGYTVTMDERKFGIATDTGCITKPMLSALAGCEAVVIEANHDVDMLQKGAYPYILKRRILSDNGHLSNENGAWLATQLALWGTKHITLGHLSDNNNTPSKAYSASQKMLSDNDFEVGKDVILQVAMKSEITEII